MREELPHPVSLPIALQYIAIAEQSDISKIHEGMCVRVASMAATIAVHRVVSQMLLVSPYVITGSGNLKFHLLTLPSSPPPA